MFDKLRWIDGAQVSEGLCTAKHRFHINGKSKTTT